MPAAHNMDISATGDVTYARISTAYAENTTIERGAFCCALNCSTLHCGCNGSSECPVQSNSSCLLSEDLQSDSLCPSKHPGASSVTAPYCWSGMNSGHITTCTSSILCSESTRSLTDNIPYLYPMSPVTAEDKDCLTAVNGICNFVLSYLGSRYPAWEEALLRGTCAIL